MIGSMAWLTLLPFSALITLLAAQQDSQRLKASALGTTALLGLGLPILLTAQQWLPGLSSSAHWLFSISVLSALAYVCQVLLQRYAAAPAGAQLWCAILGNGAALSLLLQINHSDMGLAHAIAICLLSAAGFYLALSIWTAWLKRLSTVLTPSLFRGIPLLLLSAGLIGLLLTSFGGLGDL